MFAVKLLFCILWGLHHNNNSFEIYLNISNNTFLALQNTKFNISVHRGHIPVYVSLFHSKLNDFESNVLLFDHYIN